MKNTPHPEPAAFHNLLHTFAILMAMGGLFGLLGWMIFGIMGLLMSLFFTFLFLVSTPRITPPMILRVYGARQFTHEEAPGLYAIASELARKAGLPETPLLYYVPSSVMNAFSVGSKQSSAIALSDRLVRYLTSRELTGVLAHEMSHILNNDLRLHAFADMMKRITSLLSFLGQMLILLYLPMIFISNTRIPIFFIAMLIFAPTVSMLLQLALSRNREFVADNTAISITHDPEGLASALRKMDTYERKFWDFFVLPGRKGPDPSILRTHPATAERVQRIMLMERGTKRTFPGPEEDTSIPRHIPEPKQASRWSWFQPRR
jgi:heat shock protein HtpX